MPKTSPCGNPKCQVSTGIHDGITYGSGELDSNGFWEFPCRICAKHHDDTIEQQRAEFKDKYGEEELRKADWLFIPAWPRS